MTIQQTRDGIPSQRCTLLLAMTAFLFTIACAGTRTSGNANDNTAQSNAAEMTQPSQSNSSGSATPDQSKREPQEVVRHFYDWYLGELRVGKEPFKQEQKLKQYVTDDFIREHASGPPDLDPVFGLSKSDSDWPKMKVEVSKPKFYTDKDKFDAYVEVTEKGSVEGREFTDVMVFGLKRTGAGWRIGSMSIAE